MTLPDALTISPIFTSSSTGTLDLFKSIAIFASPHCSVIQTIFSGVSRGAKNLKKTRMKRVITVPGKSSDSLNLNQ